MVNLHRLGGFCSVRLNISKGNIIFRRNSGAVNSLIGNGLCVLACNACIKNSRKSGGAGCGSVLVPVGERISVAALCVGIGNGGEIESIAEVIGFALVVGNRVVAGCCLILKGYGIFVIGLFKNGNVFCVGSDGEIINSTNQNSLAVNKVSLIACCARAEVAVLVYDIAGLLLAVKNSVPALEGIGEVVIGCL